MNQSKQLKDECPDCGSSEWRIRFFVGVRPRVLCRNATFHRQPAAPEHSQAAQPHQEYCEEIVNAQAGITPGLDSLRNAISAAKSLREVACDISDEFCGGSDAATEAIIGMLAGWAAPEHSIEPPATPVEARSAEPIYEHHVHCSAIRNSPIGSHGCSCTIVMKSELPAAVTLEQECHELVELNYAQGKDYLARSIAQFIRYREEKIRREPPAATETRGCDPETIMRFRKMLDRIGIHGYYSEMQKEFGIDDEPPAAVTPTQMDAHGQIQTIEEQWARFYCKVHFSSNPDDVPTRWAKVPTADFDEFAEHMKHHLRTHTASLAKAREETQTAQEIATGLALTMQADVAKAREALEELRSECRRVVDSLGPNSALVDDETRGRATAYASIGRQIEERLRALRLTAPGRETK